MPVLRQDPTTKQWVIIAPGRCGGRTTPQSDGLLLSPAAGAVLMSLSAVIVAINARLLRVRRVEAAR